MKTKYVIALIYIVSYVCMYAFMLSYISWGFYYIDQVLKEYLLDVLVLTTVLYLIFLSIPITIIVLIYLKQSKTKQLKEAK